MQRLIEKIEAAGFQCEAGPLTMNQDWLLLKAELGLEGHLPVHTIGEADPTECLKVQEIGQPDEPEDPLYEEAVIVVRDAANISMTGVVTPAPLQRRLRIGYTRSYRLLEEMERRGVVTAPDEMGRRKVVGHEPPQPCSCGDHK